jgi:hypothetical protein
VLCFLELCVVTQVDIGVVAIPVAPRELKRL